MSKIYVYADAGVDGFSLKQLFKSLNDAVSSSQSIVRIDAEKLATTSWEKDAAMVIFPGGRDLYYCASLGENGGIDKLKEYVFKGGCYLGICAGAYFAADSIDFERGGELEVCGERQLKFYPGCAEGPVYKDRKFSYNSLSGMRGAAIAVGQERLHAYFNGGCFFRSPEKFSQVQVLGHYDDIPENPAAIVSCQFGAGQAILSGVHIEHPSEHFIQDLEPHLIHDNENKRRTLLRTLLQSRLTITPL